MLLIIAIELQLSWNFAGNCSLHIFHSDLNIIYYDFLIWEFVYSFQQAEQDCTKAMLIDKKVKTWLAALFLHPS